VNVSFAIARSLGYFKSIERESAQSHKINFKEHRFFSTVLMVFRPKPSHAAEPLVMGERGQLGQKFTHPSTTIHANLSPQRTLFLSLTTNPANRTDMGENR
jgi:hypothetical protein